MKNAFRWKAVRYKDDIRVVMKGKYNDREGKGIQKFLQEVYGESVVVEYEGFSNRVMKFLDFKMMISDNRFEIMDNNKNVDFIEGEIGGMNKNKKIRYPEPHSSWGKKIVVNTMLGMLIGTVRRCTTRRYLIVSIVQHLYEWGNRGYSDKNIITAAYGVSVKIGNMIRAVLTATDSG